MRKISLDDLQLKLTRSGFICFDRNLRHLYKETLHDNFSKDDFYLEYINYMNAGHWYLWNISTINDHKSNWIFEGDTSEMYKYLRNEKIMMR